jgi:prephenate dehydratase
MMLGVAFQGERGAFSEEAARRMFGRGVVTLPQRSFDDMFVAVTTGVADCAMAPIENTLAGPVVRNYDLLLEHDLTIVGEVVLRVVQNLIALPGVTLAEVKRVYSHPVALEQCKRFLAAHPHLEVASASDTAGAVKMVAHRGRRDEAAIAGAPAAEAYGAHILVGGIESNTRNFTRFFVLARPDRAAALPVTAEAGRERKTSIVFHLGRRPGTLYRSLAGLAEADIDLTKIESRPIEGRPWEYSFFLDFMGDRTDPPVERALSHLATHTENLRILGSYAKGEP